MRNLDAINPPHKNPVVNLPPVFSYEQPETPKSPRKKRKKLWWLILIIIILVTGFYFGGKVLSKTNQIFANKENIFIRFGKLLIGSDKGLVGESAGQINVLLLGVGGEGHDGAFLTDTIMVASLDTKNNEVYLISVPRDFIVQLPNQGFRKINAAYPLAEVANPGSGGQAIIDSVEKVTGLKIPYYALVDFKGFIKAVDHVGGLDIAIDRTFSDSTFPDYKDWFLPTITFTKGDEHMNGERALQFARSRHGTNEEGSDFARSERQKKILSAFKEKVYKLNLTDPRTINNLLSDFTQHFRTNLEPYEIKHIVDLAQNVTKEKIYSLSLEPRGDLICAGLIDDYVNRAYVIQPCEGKTLKDIQEFLTNYRFLAKLKKENATIEIQNSTDKSYVLADWEKMADAGINIRIVPFRGRIPYDRTIIYKNTSSNPNTLEYLKSNYKFTVADVIYSGTSADFVIILGKDAL